MSKILYISCHSILEHDELKVLTELGHECFSIGAYIKPEGHYLLPRPGIDGMIPHPELEKFATDYPRNNLPQELIDWSDVIICMHQPTVIADNWEKMKGKKVIFRSIGQSMSSVENIIRRMRYEGLHIVRMSSMEENIIGYVGHDVVIKFYKDPNEWQGWNGKEKRAINMTQTLKGRRVFCHYDPIMQTLEGFPSLVYGSGNEDLGPLNGGEIPYDLMKGALRDNRCFIYGGTWPSPYTLSIQEAMMTGIPVVAIGRKLAEEAPEIAQNDRYHYYEIPDIIKNTDNGFISDNVNELRSYVHELLEDERLAERVGAEGRKTAIRLWGKDQIKEQWKVFLEKI